MTRPPDHMRRARRARRVRLLMGVAAAAFVIYRIASVFFRP